MTTLLKTAVEALNERLEELTPNATPEQILATGFHRHHMTNGEGGRLAEESRIDAGYSGKLLE